MTLGKLLKSAILWIVALLFFLEEFIWERVKRVTAWFGSLPVIKQLEGLIAKLPAYFIICVMFHIVALVFPLKLVALYWLSQGHVLDASKFRDA